MPVRDELRNQRGMVCDPLFCVLNVIASLLKLLFKGWHPER